MRARTNPNIGYPKLNPLASEEGSVVEGRMRVSTNWYASGQVIYLTPQGHKKVST